MEDAAPQTAALFARELIYRTSEHGILKAVLASSSEAPLTNDQLLERLAQLEQENQKLCERNTLLREEARWLKDQLFGRSSEKSPDVSPDQQMLFNEVEVLAAIAAAEGEESARAIRIEAHEHKAKPGRKAIPERFPLTVIVHDIVEEQKICPHDGTKLQCIGKDTAEQYDYIPPQLRVLLHERLKYACPCCHQVVKIAPRPVHILPKSMVTASFLAHITTGKFVDGLSLTRQSKQLARDGLLLGAATLGAWINEIGAEKVLPLINLMNELLLQALFIHCDETPIQVLKSHKAATSDHFMVGESSRATRSAHRAL